MRRIFVIVISVFTLLFVFTQHDSAFGQEEGHIELTCLAEMEIELINEKGEKYIKRIKAERVIPGDEVTYTIYYSVKGHEVVNNVVIDNPIPQHMTYKEKSAFGEDTDISFSIDGGETFNIPANLKILDEGGNEHLATGADYTHIRWALKKSVKPGQTGQVSYMAQLE